MFLVGVLGVGRDVYRGVTKTFPPAPAEWRSLCLSMFFFADGPEHVSRGLDVPHHPSPLTATLDHIALPFMLTALLGMLAVFLIQQRDKRRRKRRMSDPDEHKDNRPAGTTPLY